MFENAASAEIMQNAVEIGESGRNRAQKRKKSGRREVARTFCLYFFLYFFGSYQQYFFTISEASDSASEQVMTTSIS